MARIEYGILLLAVAALSFQFGAGFNPSPVPAPPEAASRTEGHRLEALERRMDALLAERVTALPATAQLAHREVVETASPLLVETLTGLREAVLASARSQQFTAPANSAPRTTNLAAIQTILAVTPASKTVDNSDLLMLTMPQVLERLGRPTRVSFSSQEILQLIYACGAEELRVTVKDGWVAQVYVAKPG